MGRNRRIVLQLTSLPARRTDTPLGNFEEFSDQRFRGKEVIGTRGLALGAHPAETERLENSLNSVSNALIIIQRLSLLKLWPIAERTLLPLQHTYIWTCLTIRGDHG